MTRTAPSIYNDLWYTDSVGTTAKSFFAQTLPRTRGIVNISNTNLAASGLMNMSGIFLEEGAIVTQIGYVVGSTAAVTPSAGFVALYDTASTPNLLAQSRNFSTDTQAANSSHTYPLIAPVQITTSGIHYVAISFTAATRPSLYGFSVDHAIMCKPFSTKQLTSRPTNSGLGGTAPATPTSFTTTSAFVPWFYLT